MSDLLAGLVALDEANPRYQTALGFYEGQASETFSSPLLQKTLGSHSPDFSFNFARTVVTSRLSRMEVSSILSQEGDADKVLADIWAANQLDQEIQDALEACLVFGDAYLIASSSEDSFDIFYNDPRDTRVFYDAENPRVKTYAIKRWVSGDKLRVNLYYPSHTERWVTVGKIAATYTEEDFTPYEEEDGVWPLPNETGRVPVFHLRTGRMYGTPEHYQAYGPQRAITKLISSQMETIDYQTGPQRYIIQDAAANAGVASHEDWEDDEDNADNSVGNGLKSGPNGLWSLAGVKSVGQFDPADPSVFIEPFKTFIEATATTTQTPLHAFNVGALPSGESLRAAEAPLNKRVESLELLFGGVIADLHEFALDTLGYSGKTVLVTWTPSATYDSKDIWETVTMKTAAGVPLRVALMEAGYTQTQVEEWFPEAASAVSTTDITRLAEAISKLSAGVTLGLISKEEARGLLPQEMLSDLPAADLDAVSESLEVPVEVPE